MKLKFDIHFQNPSKPFRRKLPIIDFINNHAVLLDSFAITGKFNLISLLNAFSM